MKRLLSILALSAVVVGGASAPAWAHDAYDDSESHPLRLIAYAVHPVGFAAEWLLMRPLHFITSQPQAERVFGHVPHEYPFGDYQAYEPEQK